MDRPMLGAPAAPKNYSTFSRITLDDNSRQVMDGEYQVHTNESVRDSGMSTNLGSAKDPHRISEKKYIVLSGTELDQHILVPDVSGCAAIKCSVMSGGTLLRSITFHSDGTDGSVQAAKEISEILAQPVENKSTSILVVTNGIDGRHGGILDIIEAPLKNDPIPCRKNFKDLNEHSTVNINMTGTHDEIIDRCNNSGQPAGSIVQMQLKKGYLIKYNALCNDAEKKGMDKESSPHYVKLIPKENRSNLDKQTLVKRNDELEKKIAEYKASDTGTCACTIL